MSEQVILCGSFGRERRSECPSPLHDWPMFSGYTAAHEEASARLSRSWRSVRCNACGYYGWVAGRVTEEVRVPHPRTPEPSERPGGEVAL